MPLKSAADEIKTFDTLVTRREPLNTRFDYEYQLYRGDPIVYDIDPKEGEWESILPNRCRSEVNRVIEDLAFAAIQLFIPFADEDMRDRGRKTKTEQTALGILHLADQLLKDSATGASLQSLLAKWWVLRGWSTKRFVLREEDDKLIPDLAIWDTRNVQWIEGRKRLTWVGYKNWLTKDEVDDQYKGWNGTVDEKGLVVVYDIWRCDELGKPAEEGVIVGGEFIKNKVVKVGMTKLDYIPINISSTRGMPLIQDDNNDNVKFTGQSYISNNSDIYPLEARLMSFFLTAAKKDAKAPIIIEFDSNKGQDPTGQFQNADPNTAGKVIGLDTAKGQRLAEPMPPSNTTNILQMIGIVRGQLGVGGMNDISFGNLDKALPAQGIDILSKAAMANERPFLAGMQGDYEWLAGEATRQYKLGKFKEQEFEGVDKSQSPFTATINPSQINEEWKFKCKLIPDLIRDKASNIQVYSQAVQAGLMSKQTAMDDGQLVLDPDSEMEKIAKENARGILGIGETEALLALADDLASATGKDKAKANFILSFAFQNFMKAMNQEQQPQPGGNGSQPAKSVVNNNQMIAKTTVPPEVTEAARRIGGG